MMRNMIRQGIRSAQNGGEFSTDGKPIATFAHDRVVGGIPPAATEAEDRALLREVARNVVGSAIRSGVEAV